MKRRVRVVEDVTLSDIELADQARTYIQPLKLGDIRVFPRHPILTPPYEVENVPIQRACVNGKEIEYAVTEETKKKLWFIFDQLNTLKSDKEVIQRELQSAKNIIKDYKLQERLMRDANLMQRMYYLFTGKLP